MAMTTPQAARADDALFNKIADLAHDDVAGHSALVFPLRKELHKDKNNPVLRAALAKALLLTGRRAEALEQLGSFMGLQGLAEIPEISLAANMFLFAGEWERCAQFRHRLAPLAAVSPTYFANALFGAFITGDAAAFESLLAEHTPRYPDAIRDEGQVLGNLKAAGLWRHLPGHFATIRRVLDGHQCVVLREETLPNYLDGMETHFTDHYLNLSVDEVVTLSRTLSDALCDFYQSVGMEPGCWVGVLQPVLHSIEVPPA